VFVTLLLPAVMLMFINAKWVEAATLNAMMMYACFYGGFGQMVAGVFEVGVFCF
jgi:succinate-acetate transporter protein